MVKCGHRRDVVLNTRIDNIVVVSYTEFIDWSSAERKETCPGNRKRVCVDTNSSQACDVFVRNKISFRAFLVLHYQKLTLFIHIIVVVRNISCTVVADKVRYTVHVHIPS